jgi:hypothetical protein
VLAGLIALRIVLLMDWLQAQRSAPALATVRYV